MIRQTDLNGNIIKEYASPYFAEKETGIPKNKIYLVLNGTRKQAGGFHWELVPESGTNSGTNGTRVVPENSGTNEKVVPEIGTGTTVVPEKSGTNKSGISELVPESGTTGTSQEVVPEEIGTTVNTDVNIEVKPKVRQIPKKTYIDAFGVEVRTMPEIQEEKPEPYFPGSNVIRHPEYFGNILETDADIMSKLKGTVFNP